MGGWVKVAVRLGMGLGFVTPVKEGKLVRLIGPWQATNKRQSARIKRRMDAIIAVSLNTSLWQD
jgi:Holliday junction resolvase-like predicted endonuclease